MSKFDLRTALVKAGRSEKDTVIPLYEGKKKIGSFTLDGKDASLLKEGDYKKLRNLIKKEAEVVYSVSGTDIVAGKIKTASRKDFCDADTFVELLDAHVKNDAEVEESVKDKAERNGNVKDGAPVVN